MIRLLSFLFFISLVSLEAGERTQIDIQVDPYGDPYYDEGPVIWMGPGIYYGIWFENERQYRRWVNERYYYRRHYYYEYDRRYRHDFDDHHHDKHDHHDHHKKN